MSVRRLADESVQPASFAFNKENSVWAKATIKKYPKGRRAPDSLLKLGISLNRLGQAEQACAAYQAVNAEYPKAVDARKRAHIEAKRARCSS